MYKICIIGSSDIIEKHLLAAKANAFKLYSITSLKKKSKNCIKIKKKFSIQKYYTNWKKCIDESSKQKNICFLVAPRIQDNIKVLNYISKFNKPILVEKPISITSKNFRYIKSKNNIFVGYNRIFYKNIKYLKRYSKRNSLISVTCAEKNKKTFMTNSCHIISILLFLYGKLNLIKLIKNKNSIIGIFRCKNNSILNLNIIFNVNCKFSIQIKSQSQNIELSPIEKLTEYGDIKIVKTKIGKLYSLKIKQIIDETNKLYKPGFFEQYRIFKKFCKNPKLKFVNTIGFSEKIIRLSEKLLSK